MQKRTVFILSGAAVLLVVLLLVGFLVVAPAITSANNAPAPTPTVAATTPPSTPTGNNKGQITKVLKQNKMQLLNQIAQGLHMTPTQLQTQLQSGKTLSQIATTQNVSAAQLQIIVTNAVKSALQPAVSNGTINQLQVNALVKRLQKNPKALETILKAKTPKTS